MYAYALNQILSSTYTKSKSKNRIGEGGRVMIKPKIFMSFENIPFHCIFPLDLCHSDTTSTEKKKKNTRKKKRKNPKKSSTASSSTTTTTTTTTILRRRHDELLLAQDYGLQSHYCICIGNTSGIHIPMSTRTTTTNSSNEYLTF